MLYTKLNIYKTIYQPRFPASAGLKNENTQSNNNVLNSLKPEFDNNYLFIN